MAELLASKLQIIEEEPRIPSFPTLPTAVLGIVGIAERGPIGSPTLITSFEEYEQTYGGLISGRELALAVRAFFLNGGRACYVSRTTHFTDVTDKNTAASAASALTLNTVTAAASGAEVVGTVNAPFVLQPADTLVGSVEGNPDDTAVFSATAGSVADGGTEPYVLANGETLEFTIDGGATQTVTFLTGSFVSIGAATAAEIRDVINAAIVGGSATGTTSVTINSDTKGTNSAVAITGGTQTALVFGAPTAGTGNVADISAVTYLEAKTIIEAAFTGGSGVLVSDGGSGKVTITSVATGAVVTLQVKAASTADGVFGFDNAVHTGSSGAAAGTLQLDGKYDGTYADGLSIAVSAATSGETEEFNLVVSKGGVTQESFPNLTMDTAAERYAVDVINNEDAGSVLLVASDLVFTGTTFEKRPANVSGASPTGGDDGLTLLDDNDFVGAAAGLTGIYALDEIEGITILAVPDAATSVVQNAMISYCDLTRQRRVFSVLDPPASQTATQIITHRNTLPVTEMGALYWPRVKIANPQKSVFGDSREIVVAPSGTIAGIYARNDLNQQAGTFEQPAGVELGVPVGVTGLETDEVKLESKRDLVFPKRINPITSMEGFGIFLDGARTLKGTGNFPSVGERRGVSQIERLLSTGLQFARHRNNTPTLRRRVERAITALLLGFTLRGALASNDPTKAFFVDVSDKLNTPSVVRAGKLLVRVGLATAKPAEFIVVKISQDTRALEEELLSSGL